MTLEESLHFVSRFKTPTVSLENLATLDHHQLTTALRGMIAKELIKVLQEKGEEELIEHIRRRIFSKFSRGGVALLVEAEKHNIYLGFLELVEAYSN